MKKQKKLFSIHKEATKYKTETNYTDTLISGDNIAQIVKETKNNMKTGLQNILKKKWREKSLHGQYPARLDREEVSLNQSQQWLNSSGLKAETEGLILAAQDQCLTTNNYKNKIMKVDINTKCRMCNQYNETVDHIISGCPVLAKSEYIYRHDRIGSYIHWTICRHYKIETDNRWYKHVPNKVQDNEQATIIWDMPVQTDKEIKANRPDIIVKDWAKNTCLLIDVSVPSDQNIVKKEVEKLSKYKDLEIEVFRMWGMKVKTVPIVVGALGMIKKHMNKNIEDIPGSLTLHTVQKIALLGTAHILRKTLSI